MTEHAYMIGFACGYLTCAVGAVVGWSLARWMGARKAKRVVRVEKAAAICRREGELDESLKAYCADGVNLGGYNLRYQPKKAELETHWTGIMDDPAKEAKKLTQSAPHP